MRWGYQTFFIAVFFISIFIVLVFLRTFVSGDILITGDNFDLIFPQKQFFIDQINSKHFPLWNPYILSGTPYLADINLATLSPFNIIYFIFSPVERAGTYLVILEIFLIGIGMYVLSRHYHISESGSILTSLIFIFSGSMLSYVTNLSIINVVVFIPLLIYLSEKFVRTYKLSTLLSIGFFYGLQIISGHIQITYYTGIVLTAFIFLYAYVPFVKKAFYVLIIVITAVCVSLFQLFPFLEFAFLTPRFNQDLSWVTQGQLTFFDIVKIVIPKSLWSITGWVDFSAKQTVGYIGVVPLVLSIVGLLKARSRFLFWSCISVISLILSLGSNSPIYMFLYKFLPFFSSFRIPSQALIFFTFSASLLAGYGFDYIINLRLKISLKAIRYYLFLSISLFVIFSTVFYLLIYNRIYIADHISNIFVLIHNTSLNPYKYVVTALNIYLIFVLLSLFTVGVLFVLLHKKIIGRTIVITTILLDIFLSTQASIVLGDIQTVVKSDKVVITGEESDKYKIYTIPPIQKPSSLLFLPSIEELFAQEKNNMLLPNHNIFQKIYSLDGYASMAVKNYIDIFTDSSQTVTGLGKIDYTIKKLRDNGVGFIISKTPLFGNSEIKLITSHPYYVYTLIEKIPRVSITGSNSYIISQKETVGRLSVNTVSESKSMLIYRDVMYPGWNVYIDGKSSPLNIYNNVYKSVEVPSGFHLVEFKYEPTPPFIGMIVSTVSIVSICYCAVWYRNKTV